MKKWLACILVVVSGVCFGAEAKRVQDNHLIWALISAETVAERGPVKVIKVSEALNDCESIASCPNVRLYVLIVEGDEDETPAVYALPDAKGWTFGKWLANGFAVTTTFPDHNIPPVERKSFHPVEYSVTIVGDKVTYERH